MQLENLPPAETNPLEVAVKSNLEPFLKCHFCRNVSPALFCLSQSRCQAIDSRRSSSNIQTPDCRDSQVSQPAQPCCCWFFLCVTASSSPRLEVLAVVVDHKTNLFVRRKMNTLKLLVQCSERTKCGWGVPQTHMKWGGVGNHS